QRELVRERTAGEQRPVDLQQVGVPREEVPRRRLVVRVERLHAPRDLLLARGAFEEARRVRAVLLGPSPVALGRQALRQRDEKRLLLERDALQDGAEDFADIRKRRRHRRSIAEPLRSRYREAAGKRDALTVHRATARRADRPSPNVRAPRRPRRPGTAT